MYNVLSTPNNAVLFVRNFLLKPDLPNCKSFRGVVPPSLYCTKSSLFLISLGFYSGVVLTQMYSILRTTNYWGTHNLHNKQL